MSKLTLSPLIRTRENKRWDWTSNPVLSGEQAIVCPYVKCGKIFSEPIELTVRAEGSLETYYACPHCFSKVEFAVKEEKQPLECPYYFGFLKTLQKKIPIPDECLTCPKLIPCKKGKTN